MLQDPNTYIYICGMKEMEDGVDRAFANIAESIGQDWRTLRDVMRLQVIEALILPEKLPRGLR